MTRREFHLTYAIIGITILFYLIQNIPLPFSGGNSLVFYGVKINEAIEQGQLWRLLTPVLLHGSLIHLGFNMYALFSLGPALERKYGEWPFIALYLMGAVWGNTLSFLLSPNPSLGASTAIFGLIAAHGVYIYKNRHLLGSRAQPLLMNILMLVVVNLFLGLNPGIDNWGHVGGLLGGLFFAWFAGPSFGIIENIFGQSVVVKDATRPILIFIAGILAALAIVYLKIFFF